MESTLDSVRSMKKTKEEKKLLRKQIKSSHTLLKHEGIITVSHPTKNLVVANGGLGNGVTREQLQAALTQAGCVEALLMPPNKPYAFVTYATLDGGQRAHALLNGHTLCWNDQSVTLYLSFVQKVGSERCVCADLPPDLAIVEEFVSPEEETLLLQAVDWQSQTDDITPQKSLKHRRVKHYGYEFRYDNNNVDKDKPLAGGLPKACDAVLQRCLHDGLITVLPDQLTVNQYECGQGIPPHVDTHSAFEDTILSLSLGAKTVMDFRHPEGRSVAVLLPCRSLLVMKGESRYLWTHGITPRKFDVVPASGGDGSGSVTSDLSNLTLSRRGTRTSFTFRKVRRTPCDCAYPSACDSQSSLPPGPSLPHSEEDACVLEGRFVHQVYEDIASHFSSTRHSPWPRVRDFLLALRPGAFVADVGCGNGKYLGVNPEVMSLGCDRSSGLVGICAERGFQAFVSDALAVPLRSSCCDACISIAVIHHFSTQERRLAAIKELTRLLRPGGRALIYVWAMEQEHNKQRSKYLKESKESGTKADGTGPWEERSGNETPNLNSTEENSRKESLNSNLFVENSGNLSPNPNPTKENSGKESMPKLSVHTNRTAFNSQDLLVPWHLKSDKKAAADGPVPKLKPSSSPVYHRYYHVFQQGELEELCRSIKEVEIKSSYHDQGNWCIILEKTPENSS